MVLKNQFPNLISLALHYGSKNQISSRNAFGPPKLGINGLNPMQKEALQVP